MKIKRITVGIKSLGEGLKEFTQAVKGAQNGIAAKKKRATYFVDLKSMLRVLTPKRMELLHAIRQKHPGSVYELSQMTHRDLKNVQNDVSLLARMGLVGLKKKKEARERVIPTVNYENLQLQIPV